MTIFRKKSSFTNVNDVLGTVMSNIKLDQRLREHSLFSLWPYIVGDGLSRLSRPLFLDHTGVMVVACSDASASQELSLKKMQIQDQIRKAAKGMNVNVTGIRFDIKLSRYVKEDVAQDPVGSQRPLSVPEIEQIEKEIDLSPEDFKELEALKTALIDGNVTDPKLRERILLVHKRELSLRQWYRKNGCPTCPSCGMSTAHLHWQSGVCGTCYIESVK